MWESAPINLRGLFDQFLPIARGVVGALRPFPEMGQSSIHHLPVSPPAKSDEEGQET